LPAVALAKAGRLGLPNELWLASHFKESIYCVTLSAR